MNHGECVGAAFANAIRALAREKVAMDFHRRGVSLARNLADAQWWFHKHLGRYHFSKKDQTRLDDIYCRHERLMEGIYLVRILGKDEVDEKIDNMVVHYTRK